MSLAAQLRATLLALSALMFCALPGTAVQAAVVDTPTLLSMQPSDERAALHELLARGDVREQMQSMGVDPVAAAARIDRLSDTEVAELQAQLHTAPAGGVSVIGAALVVFLVLVFTDVIGATDIFPFIRPVKR